MKAIRSLFPVILLSATCAGLAHTQTPESPAVSDVRIVSSFVQVGAPVPEQCRAESGVLARTMIRYPLPASWHWVLVCDETGWRRFLRLSGRDERAAIYASTCLRERVTYIRGAKLLIPYDLDADPDEVIAHELAHIWLQSATEDGANRLAQLWRENGK